MDPYGLECLLPLLAEAHARGAGHSKGRCTSVLRACVRMVSNGLAAKSGFDRIRGWRSRSACLQDGGEADPIRRRSAVSERDAGGASTP